MAFRRTYGRRRSYGYGRRSFGGHRGRYGRRRTYGRGRSSYGYRMSPRRFYFAGRRY